MTFLLVMPGSGFLQENAGSRPFAMKVGAGRVSLQADSVDLLPVLAALSRQAGMDIFIAEELVPGPVQVEIRELPTEEALKRLLRDYSYAAIFTRSGNELRITTVNIYPRGGRQGGAMKPVFFGSTAGPMEANVVRTVMVDGGEEIATYGSLADGGLLVPSRIDGDGRVDLDQATSVPWLGLQVEMEQEESRLFEEQLLLKKKIEATDDPVRQEALSAAYAGMVENFLAVKMANYNKIEAIKRIFIAAELEEKRQ